MITTARSLEKITVTDLQRLAAIARMDREDLFRRKPDLGKLYAGRLICVTLCQGAALHYIDSQNGVKDFDVWTFFHGYSKQPFPYRRNVHRDFGHPKFGTSPDRPDFVGRRVDLIGRSIRYKEGLDLTKVIQNYLIFSSNKSPRLLAKKAIVILEPKELLGKVAWPISGIT